jgi:AcrR family transcriptional regulator
MVKRVDYSSRFEFLRQAAFSLVLDRGVHALTLRALAAELELGVNTVRRLVDPSTELAALAADEVLTRRRAGRWGRLPEDPDDAARTLMHRLLPDELSRIDEELVWLRLVASHATVPGSRESARRLRHDFQIAERGWSDVELDGVHLDPQVEPQVEASSGAMAMAPYFSDRETQLDMVIDRVLTLLEVGDPGAESVRLRALVDGLTIAVCRGRISPEEAVQTADRHLASLRQPPVRVAG